MHETDRDRFNKIVREHTEINNLLALPGLTFGANIYAIYGNDIKALGLEHLIGAKATDIGIRRCLRARLIFLDRQIQEAIKSGQAL